MILRKIFSASLLALFVAAVLVSGCKKTETSQPLEPISLVMPDSPIITAFDSDLINIQLKFTADKPLNYIMGVYDIDTTFDTTAYTPAYADTLFYENLVPLTPRQNLYTWNGTYQVPGAGAAKPFSIIRFKFMFTAGSNTPVQGQNYSVGIDTAVKELKINIR
jgi:hypothetical protein